MKCIRFILIFVFLFAHISLPETRASEEDLLNSLKTSDAPVIVKGDKVEYFRDEKKVVGEGDVSISYGDVKLECDKIIVYTDTKEAICEGNVRISQPGASFESDKVNYNFSEKKGYAIESDIKIKPFYGWAKRLEQKGEKQFEIERGYVTTCDLEKPHYRIQAKEVRIFLGRKIVAKHILFYVGNIPILYMPIYVQPLNEKFPEVTIVPGRTSDWGYYALTAWRYYLNDNAKGFINLDYREKKGLAEGIDYQFNTKELGSGMARFYYTRENDDLTINKTGEADNRWRIQYRHNLNLPEDTTCTIEINKLSDRDMIKDYLYREYEDNPMPDNYILVETAKPNYIFSVLARKRLDNFFTVVERLPEAKLEVNSQQLWNTNFYYFSQSSATNFIKRYDEVENRSAEEAIRMDTFQKLSYAAKLLRFLYVTPFIATRQTFYSQNRWEDPSQLRSIYEGGADVSTKFYKVFDIESNFLGLDLHKLRHIITPQVGYLTRHQPTISPENLHQFDEIDAIDTYNGFSLFLENKLQTKRPEGDSMKTVDLARFVVSTDYMFRLKKKSIESKGEGKFGDIWLKLELWPYSWFHVDSNMTLNHKNCNVNSANIDAYFNLGEKFTLGVGHRYESTDSGKTSQLTGEMYYNINDDWKVKVYERFDFASQKWEEQEYTIFKSLHCWEAELTFNIREDDYTTWLVFRLKAFPEIPIGLFKTTYHRPYPGGRR